MTNQGLYGALEQYWKVDPAPRLDRKNTYFEDRKLSSWDALNIVGIAVVVAVAIIGFWCMLGVIL